MPPAAVIAIFGPTGAGKTAVAVALAGLLARRGERAVAVSADALQVYAGLEVLTGAASVEERQRLEHRLVGILPVSERFSAGEFARRAHREIDALLAEGRVPIVVGGTGLYLVSALSELSLRPPPAPGVRERWLERLAAEGPEALHGELAARAPQAAGGIAPGDGRRIVRALELLDSGEHPPGGDELWAGRMRHPTLLAGLMMDRAALAARIDARVEEMAAAGAAAEVRAAEEAGASATARKALGYEHLLRGDIEGMKAATRRYAKRQLTWMRKLPADAVIDVTGRSPDDVAAELLMRAGRPAG